MDVCGVVQLCASWDLQAAALASFIMCSPSWLKVLHHAAYIWSRETP